MALPPAPSIRGTERLQQPRETALNARFLSPIPQPLEAQISPEDIEALEQEARERAIQMRELNHTLASIGLSMPGEVSENDPRIRLMTSLQLAFLEREGTLEDLARLN